MSLRAIERRTVNSPHLPLTIAILLASSVICCFGLVIPEEASSECQLANTTLDRFKYLTFYSWHFVDGNWTNVGQSSSPKELWSFYNATKRPSLMEIQQVFFQSMTACNSTLKGLCLRSDYLQQWNATTEAITPLVKSGVIVGFFLGDELVWNNITWDQLNVTAALVKTTFPSAFVFYNEGGAPLWGNYNVNGFRTEYPHVPFAIDFASTDDYDSMSIVKNPIWMYQSFLYPKLVYPHQRAFVIPPVYGWLNATCNVQCWDEIEFEQAVAYFKWIDSDDRIVGLSGFHFSTYLPSDMGIVSLPRTLSCYQNVSKQLIDNLQIH